jgi:hypothetical protein
MQNDYDDELHIVIVEMLQRSTGLGNTVSGVVIVVWK